MMTEEEFTEDEKEEKPKEIYKTEPPKATAPPVEPEKPPETTSGIDVTARMDTEQKEVFKKMKAKAQAVPQNVSVKRPFCERLKAVKERRAARREARRSRG